ncbi:hypothetical protein [Chachezhania sediminis]|uniref:hypothetical protein n=1 Tax=Chachezhania sediminis TaxID=2599291 RepID=UPI00131DB721|nr:hypothetical protein [Chachezhania sediminis]
MRRLIAGLFKILFQLAVLVGIVFGIAVLGFALLGPLFGADFSAPVQPRTAAVTLEVE